MLRASSHYLQPIVFSTPSPLYAILPVLTNLRNLSFSPQRKLQNPFHRRITFISHNYHLLGSKFNLVPGMIGQPSLPKATAPFNTQSSSKDGREILVQHLLVKENDQKLLLELQKKAAEGIGVIGRSTDVFKMQSISHHSQGEDLSDLATEYSICPSKDEGGMLGWVRKGQMVAEFEEAAFGAPLNKVVRCKTKFGWHLLQVLSEREESVLGHVQTTELHEKMQDPTFLEDAQLIDVREPDEVSIASLPGFHVLPLRQFGIWGPEITTKFDPQKDTYVMCHHGMRSMQVAQWLQTQGFKKLYNVTGGIHDYALKVDPSIPTY